MDLSVRYDPLAASTKENALAIVNAAWRGDFFAVQKALDSGVPIGAFHPAVSASQTAIQVASHMGRTAFLRLLIERERSPSVRMARGPLSSVPAIGKPDVFLNVRRRNIFGHDACYVAQTAEVLFLLLQYDKGAAKTTYRAESESLLTRACEKVCALTPGWTAPDVKRLVDEFDGVVGTADATAAVLTAFKMSSLEPAKSIFWFLVKDRAVALDAEALTEGFLRICPLWQGAVEKEVFDPMLAALVEKGLDIHVCDASGKTAMELSSATSAPIGVHLIAHLIRWGASVRPWILTHEPCGDAAFPRCHMHEPAHEAAVLRDALHERAFKKRAHLVAAFHSWKKHRERRWERTDESESGGNGGAAAAGLQPSSL